jgi:hypothetical protein
MRTPLQDKPQSAMTDLISSQDSIFHLLNIFSLQHGRSILIKIDLTDLFLSIDSRTTNLLKDTATAQLM